MSLRLVYGRAGSGKSFFCLNDIKSKLNDGRNTPLILVVPEQFTLQAEKNLVKAVGTGGIMRAEVLSFRRMAHRVFNEVGGAVRRHINSAGKCMLICRVIDSMKDELKVFSKAARQQGFVGIISDMIAEFKRYNVTPEHLKNVGKRIDVDELLKSKLEEIGAIYEKFEKKLHERYIDSDDDLTELAKKVQSSGYLDGAEIWIDEFSGFTPQEYKVIEELLKKAERVSICLCTDCLEGNCDIDGTDVFSPSRNAAARLLRIAGSCGIGVEEPVRCGADRKSGISLEDGTDFDAGAGRFRHSREIAHLERNIFSYPYKVFPYKTRDIKIFSAANIYSEVEDTARDIISLCRDRGVRFRDIAVVTRNLEGYEGLIRAIFGEYGIPYFIDRKKDIDDHPLIRLVLSSLEIFINNWSYESVFRYLKTGLTGVKQEDIDIIENYVLAFGIKGNKWTQNEPWNFRLSTDFESGEMSEYEKSVLDRVNEVRLMIAGPLLDFYSKAKGRKKAKDICAALYEFLCSIGVPERIEEWTDKFKESGEIDLAVEYGQVWNILIEVFNQIVEVMGDESTGIERFSRILEIGLSQYKTGLIPLALDQVLVGSVERSKSHEISAMYILGVNDGVFPAVSNQEGILSDKDREILQSYGVELAQDTRTKVFVEQYLVYTTLTTASKYLRLSYPAADHEGRAMRPSIIISRLKKIFPQIDEQSNIVAGSSDDDDLRLIATPAPTFNGLVAAVRKQVEGSAANSLWWDVLRWYRENEEWKEKCEAMLSGIAYTNRVGLSPEKARKLYGSPLNISVSRLERFAACPFSFYVQYGLKARERRIFRLEPPDVGTFMHDVIDRFSKRLAERNMSWRNLEMEWCSSEVSKIVEELLQSMAGSVLSSSKRYRNLAERLKRVLTRAVWIIAEHIKRGGFDPMGYEIVFGEDGKFPPIMIELPSGEKIKLTGRIDRIDALKTEKGTYLRIIDYKSGSKAFKLSDVYYGLQIQLIAYMDAILSGKAGGFSEPLIPGGIFYFKIDDPVVKAGRGASEEEIEKALMKELKMKGLLLADVKLIKEMDRQIDGNSLIIPARINKGDVLGKSSAATLEQFELLRRHVRRLLARIGEEMLKGNVSIKPYKKRRLTSCAYCSYMPVCHFDPSFGDSTYRTLNDIKEEDIWGLIRDEQVD